MSHEEEFIFNTSFHVSTPLVKDWINWLQENLIPGVKNSVPDVNQLLFEIISANDNDTRVFVLQWHCPGVRKVNAIDAEIASHLAGSTSIFGEGVLFFSSIMKRI